MLVLEAYHQQQTATDKHLQSLYEYLLHLLDQSLVLTLQSIEQQPQLTLQTPNPHPYLLNKMVAQSTPFFKRLVYILTNLITCNRAIEKIKHPIMLGVQSKHLLFQLIALHKKARLTRAFLF